MMNTAFSSGSKLLYTSATVAKPSLSRGMLCAIADEEDCSTEEDNSVTEDSGKICAENEELDSDIADERSLD